MALTDDDLLDFDASRLENFDLKKARALLAGEDAEVFRSQLRVAKWIDLWLERMHPESVPNEEFQKGFERGISEVAAHLRQGDLIPGGVLYDQVT